MVKTEILSIETPAEFDEAVERACALLRRGQLVALPTETVYGLAANALSIEAVKLIFSVKGRPPQNPIITHVCDAEMARACASQWPDVAARLAATFWPGPLTLVLPKSQNIPAVVTAGGPTVGIRMPRNTCFLEIIRRCGFPLAAPSANPANRLSPTTARHVFDYFQDVIPLVVDGGESEVGIESTVVDLSAKPWSILRPGMIHEPALAAVLGPLQPGPARPSGAIKSPGRMPRHYSPRARLRIWPRDRDGEWLKVNTQPPSEKVAVICHNRLPPSGVASRNSMLPREAQAFARSIYAELHATDAAGIGLVWVEEPPDSPEWRAILDRLRRAAS